ncbi:hypothetical protein D3C77_97900 [compost metagenome]
MKVAVAPVNVLNARREPQVETQSVEIPAQLHAFGLQDHERLSSLDKFVAQKCWNVIGQHLDFPVTADGIVNNILALVKYIDQPLPPAGRDVAAIRLMTTNIVSTTTPQDLQLANEFALEVERLNQAPGISHQAPLDCMLNNNGDAYHNATVDDGRRMGHAREMQSDMAHIHPQGEHLPLLKLLAYAHDHIQIKDHAMPSMGVGNSLYPGLNELLTAALLAELAPAATPEQKAAVLKIAAAVIPSGTKFGFMPDVSGRPVLGTPVEAMAIDGSLKSLVDTAASPGAAALLLAFSFALSTCDTGRNNLKGVARCTQEHINATAPALMKVLNACAGDDKFKQQFFTQSGQLSERGLALASKLSTTVRVFEEFDQHSPAVNANGLTPRNPLSRNFVSGSCTDERQAILNGIATNGEFGVQNLHTSIPDDLADLHPIIKNIRDLALFPPQVDPKAIFKHAFELVAQALGKQPGCESAEGLRAVLEQFKQVGGAPMAA